MAINKDMCDGNCTGCEANKSNWCIIKDISCTRTINNDKHESKDMEVGTH
jgi:hypothetical protein